MSALLRRLVRLWGQSRIRLPRCPPGPEEIGAGDRLQIGSRVWRVEGRLLLESGGWMFRLEAMGEVPGEREGRLRVSGGSSPSPGGGVCNGRGGHGVRSDWRLFHDGTEHLLPADCVIVFPAPHVPSFDKPEATA